MHKKIKAAFYKVTRTYCEEEKNMESESEPKRSQSKIFSLFFTTHRERERERNLKRTQERRSTYTHI